jgi:hypothetical protein
MKRINILQYAFVITGIIFGYQALITLMMALWSLWGWFGDGTVGSSQFFPRLNDYIFLAIQLAACWGLIMRSDKLTVYVSKNVNLDNGFKVNLLPSALIQIICIAMGIYFALQNMPRLLSDLINGFREKVGTLSEGPTYFQLPVMASVLQVLLAILLVVASKPIAVFLARNIPTEPITLQQQIEEIESSNTTV